jgi:hypothetical protein
MSVFQSAGLVSSARLLAEAIARTDSVGEIVAFATATLLVGAAAIESVAMEAVYFINPSLLKSKRFICITHLFNSNNSCVFNTNVW